MIPEDNLLPKEPTVVDPSLGGPPTAPTALAPRSAGRPSKRFARLVPNLVLLLAGFFFVAPLLTLARFAFQKVQAFQLGKDTLFKRWTFEGPRLLFSDEYRPQFLEALKLSLTLAVGTVFLALLLLVPTAIWVHLRVPKARALIEFLTVLPYMIPAIALVAGIFVIRPHARWFLNSDFALIPFYVVLSLPFTYRSLDAGLKAIDLRTLVDASRSLGEGWVGTIRRAIIPNLRVAIISVSFLTAAVVIGEFTIADTLLKETLPRFQATFVGQETQAGYGLNLIVLLATTLLFVVLSIVTKQRNPRRKSFAHQIQKHQALATETAR